MTKSAHIHQARVYLREARQRADIPAQRGFCFVLLGWAANCRRRAAAVRTEPVQAEIFGHPI